MREKALTYFRGAERYNCAQAVFKSSEKHTAVCDEQLEVLKKSGSGRAEGGLCGALFAAEQVVENEEVRNCIRSYFEDHAGSVLCREIRGHRQMSCRDCVAAAAAMLDDHLSDSD